MIRLLLDPASYVLNPNALPTFLTAVAVVWLGIDIVIRERQSRVSVHFFVLTLTMAIWLFAFSWMYCATSARVAMWWVKAAYLGVPLIPSALYHFTSSTLRIVDRRRRLIRVSWALSIVFSVVAIGTDLLIRDVRLYPWGFYPQFRALSIPFLVFFFGMLIVTMWEYGHAYRMAAGSSHIRIHAFMTAFSVAYLASADYIAAFGIPVYPFGYLPILGFLVLTARAVRRYHLVDFSPTFAANEILAIMQEAVIVTDDRGLIRVANDAARAITGLDEDGMAGRSVEALFVPGEAGHDGWRQVWTQTRVQDAELTLRRRDGPPVEVAVSFLRLDDRAGGLLGTVSVFRDVSQRKRFEAERDRHAQELARSNEALRELDRLRSEMITNISHELRTPLVSLSISLELLQDNLVGKLSARDAELLQVAQRNYRRLERLVRDVLYLSRIERGRLSMAVSSVCPVRLVEEALEQFRMAYRDKRLHVLLDIGEDVQEIHADPGQMDQIMSNLLSNAGKYTPVGGTVGVRVKRDGAGVLICVWDTGPGVPEAYRERIFERFFRVQEDSQVQGAGIGLAIVKGIVEQHGGRVWVEGGNGRGAIFNVYLPASYSPHHSSHREG